MTDPELLTAAIHAAGLSARRFAVAVLDVDERTVRRWLVAEREMPGPARQVCRAVIKRPSLASLFARLSPPSDE